MAVADAEQLFASVPRTWHRRFWRRRAEPAVYPYPVERYQLYAQSVQVVQSLRLQSPVVASGVVNFPFTYARSPDGTVYFANGLGPVLGFDGVIPTAKQAGVPAPATALTLAASGSGSISGNFVGYQRFLDKDGRWGNLSPVSNTLTAASNATITYSNVPLPTDAKITRRQLLRNTSGQDWDLYIDVDTTDLTSTSFSSTRTNAQLGVRSRVPLFDTDGRSLADRFGVPRSDKPVICTYLDRMFLAGEVTYAVGSVEVTAGSTTVQGIGTQWTSSLAGRSLYLVGHDRFYQISSVDTTNQTLTLTSVYQGSTDTLAPYYIRSAAAERRTLYWTEAGHYEAWSAVNGLTIEENGDETTGLMPADSFLFILQRRHIFRLTYRLGPDRDGGLFLAARRGCVNHRCWIYLDGAAYLLDEQGVYRFRADDAEQLSRPVQDLWFNDRPAGAFRINWAAQRWFHACHNRDESCIRWFVALSGSRLPRHALCYNYVTNSFWVEEYPFVLGASVQAETDLPRSLAAGPAKKIFVVGDGTLDAVNPDGGTTQSVATSASTESLVDAYSSYAGNSLAGAPVSIIHGTGKGQTRIISAVSGTTLRVVQPWLTRPDATSRYQLGGTAWRWLSHWTRWNREEGNQERRLELLFEPATRPAQLDVRIYKDHAQTPENFGVTGPVNSSESVGVTTTKGLPDARIDLTTETGFAQVRLSARRERYVQRADLLAIELRGHLAPGPVTVRELVIEGAQDN